MKDKLWWHIPCNPHKRSAVVAAQRAKQAAPQYVMALQLFNDSDFLTPFFAGLHGSQFRWNADQLPAVAARPTLLDVQEKDKAFEVAADLPGVNKEDIKLHVEGDVISLAVVSKTDKKDVTEKNGVKVHRQERSAGFMKRSLRMPESADLSQLQARYHDGVLRLEIPKHEPERTKARIIAIE